MLITYSAVDGYSIESSSTAAWLMADTDAAMVTDQLNNSPLKNLTENGTVTTAVVDTDATTLAASSFSSVNFYSLAYDAAFDPGANGFSMKCWMKVSSYGGTVKTAIDHSAGTTSPLSAFYRLFIATGGQITGQVSDGTNQSTAAASSAITLNEWVFAALVYDDQNDTLSLYINGDLVTQNTGLSSIGSLSNASASLQIGRLFGSVGFDTGSIAGVEIDVGNQWTAQQIKTKYNLESILFRQREPFSIVGNSIDYEVNLIASSVGNAVSQHNVETLDGSMSGITWYRKRNWACQSISFARSDLGKALKFLRSTNNVTFTFDERGSLSNSPTADDPVTVYKTSSNETVQFSNPYYSFAFNLREA